MAIKKENQENRSTKSRTSNNSRRAAVATTTGPIKVPTPGLGSAVPPRPSVDREVIKFARERPDIRDLYKKFHQEPSTN